MTDRRSRNNRYLVTVGIGDGGEMYATAYPEDITDPHHEIRDTDDHYSVWVDTYHGSGGALEQGVKMARAYFARAHAAAEDRRLASIRAKSDLYREPPTGGEA